MARFAHRSWIDAPLESVWEFHSEIDGLTALTPGIAGLSVDSLRVPGDGTKLIEGSEIDLAVRPFPGGPGQQFTSVIVDRDRNETSARFVDEMRAGPMESGRHVHRFVAVDGGTLLVDDIEYETGFGPAIDRVLELGFAVAFRYRHRKTREILAGA